MSTVTVADATVHYETAGTGPVLVLVHGTGSAGAALTWGQVAPRLSAGRTVVTVDLSGSDATTDAGGPLTVAGLAAQVVAVVGALDSGPVDLLGFSMGAVVAAAVAAEHPDLVRDLILLSGWAHTDGDEYVRNLFTLWSRIGPLDADAFGRSITMTGFSRPFLNRIGRDEVERLVPNLPPTAGTLRHVDLNSRVDIRGLLPRITARTLVIGAARDATVPVEHSRALHAAIRDSEYAEVDAGHVLFFERLDAFLELVERFLHVPLSARR